MKLRPVLSLLVLLMGLLVAGAQSAAAASLEEVTGVGSNPGNLRMFRYVPPGLGTGRPVVVALHGCTQSATAYDDEPGWVAMAQRAGFGLVLPQQQSANNASQCFNWFEAGDTARGAGEALSIKQMVDRTVSDLGSDAGRVFVTGLSAGGAMAAVMLATYPDTFAGGAIVAGLPYRCATSLFQAFSCQNPGVDLSPQQWGDKVRAAASGTHRPKVSVWQGTADYTVAYRNLNELMEQWTNVDSADQTADATETVNGATHKSYADSSGATVVETWSIPGMGHGQPVDPGTGADQCGTAAPYILDVNLCAAAHIIQFWGLA
jgi:poly(hydroxyalkanoate) depolymerase family esterase